MSYFDKRAATRQFVLENKHFLRPKDRLTEADIKDTPLQTLQETREKIEGNLQTFGKFKPILEDLPLTEEAGYEYFYAYLENQKIPIEKLSKSMQDLGKKDKTPMKKFSLL